MLWFAFPVFCLCFIFQPWDAVEQMPFNDPVKGLALLFVVAIAWIAISFLGGRESGMQRSLYEAFATLEVVANEQGLTIKRSMFGKQSKEYLDWEQIVAFSGTTQDDAYASDLILHTKQGSILLDSRLNAKGADTIITRLSRFQKNSTKS